MLDTSIIVIGLLIWNCIIFFLYGWDKYCAKQKRRRVSEQTLLLTALFLGAPGALIAMYTWRHKTKKPIFFIGVPLLLLINIAVCVWMWNSIA